MEGRLLDRISNATGTGIIIGLLFWFSYGVIFGLILSIFSDTVRDSLPYIWAGTGGFGFAVGFIWGLTANLEFGEEEFEDGQWPEGAL